MQLSQIGPNHIFRTIIFNYNLQQTIPLQLICKVIAQLYYPNDPTGQITKRFKTLLISHMKQFTNQQKVITQEQFCSFYQQMEKYNSEQYTQRLCQHLFDRHKNKQQKTQQIIDLQGWMKMSESFQLSQDQAKECFYHIANRKNVITFDKLLQYMAISNTKTK